MSMNETSVQDWIDGVYEGLRHFIQASDPVGDDETGWLVKVEYKDLTINDFADKLFDRLPDDKSYLCYILAAALMFYTVDRVIIEDKKFKF